VCHQYKIRQKLLKEDLETGLPADLNPKDFVLAQEPYSKEHRLFIERYEWLGNVGQCVGKIFTARWSGKLAGVVIIGAPNAYSFDVTLEALIQRGACASWTPKNLGSMLVMFGCRWMVNNTEKRIFTAYSDPEAGEIGTIYQSCNFDYLGAKWGASKMYFFEGKWRSLRTFTNTWGVHRWAKELGIEWLPEWTIAHSGRQNLKTIPKEITRILRGYAKSKADACPTKSQPKKGKYVLLLGKDKREAKKLQPFKTWKKLPYPKRSED
jgi:hypothetical protein